MDTGNSNGVVGHLRPDLVDRLVNAISNLCWSKQAVLDLFKNAGVPEELLHDFQQQVIRDRHAVKKPIMARALLQRMNAAGDAPYAIRMRRELVRRVVEWKDYSNCQPNCEAIARGEVAAVREIVGKYDFVTEIRQDRDRRISDNLQKVDAERQELARCATEWENIKSEFAKCICMLDHRARGLAFEQVLNRLFVHAALAARPPFTIRSDSGKPLEQIDGSIELERFVYIIEAKWWEGLVDKKELSAFALKVFFRDSAQVRGIVISASGYTEGAVQVAKEAFTRGRPILLMTLREFFDVLQANGDVRQLILDRVRIMNDEKRVTPPRIKGV